MYRGEQTFLQETSLTRGLHDVVDCIIHAVDKEILFQTQFWYLRHQETDHAGTMLSAER